VLIPASSVGRKRFVKYDRVIKEVELKSVLPHCFPWDDGVGIWSIQIDG